LEKAAREAAREQAIPAPEMLPFEAEILNPDGTYKHNLGDTIKQSSKLYHEMLEAEIVEPATCGGNPDILPNVALSDSPLFQSRVGDNLTAKTDLPNPKDLIGATKPPLDLVPSALTIHVAGVMALGARKYGKFNWRQHKVKYSIYLAAALRHLAQAADGEDIDPESGQPHLAHAAACCGIVLDAVACNMVIDDRGAPGPASRLLAANTKKV
jgi:hypothetical protein